MCWNEANGDAKRSKEEGDVSENKENCEKRFKL
jgi:hypothetical protein